MHLIGFLNWKNIMITEYPGPTESENN